MDQQATPAPTNASPKKTTARAKVWIRAALAAAGCTALVATAAVAGPVATATAVNTEPCQLFAPARWVVSSPFRSTPLTWGGPGCEAPGQATASWEAHHPTKGLQTTIIFERTTTENWDIYDDRTALGLWTWQPRYCYYPLIDTCSLKPATTDIRVGGWAGLKATRSGSYVTLSTTFARYAYTLDRFVPWAGTRGTIQYSTPDAGWVSLKYVYPNSKGKYSYRYTFSSARDYRVVFPSTPLIWNGTSKTVRQ